MRKKILFIIPYIPYPLDSGGNQAFFNMVEYLRHKRWPYLYCFILKQGDVCKM